MSACFGASGVGPNDRQREALEAALRTPDILLVQGPPGTGKTRLVAAIQTRLAELAEASELVSGQVLLTSYQHEAVDNAAAHSEVYGLPAVKVGRRFGEEFRLSSQVAEWRARAVVDVDTALGGAPPTPLSSATLRLRGLVAMRSLAPGNVEQAASLLQEGLAAVRPFAGPALLSAFDAASSGLHGDQSLNDGARLRKLAEALPQDGETWSSDARRAAAGLFRSGALSEDERTAFAEAARCSGPVPPADIDVVRATRRRILSARQNAGDDPILGVLTEALRHLRSVGQDGPEGVRRALEEYRGALVGDPEAFEEALMQYTVTLAATCSQAGGHRMAQAKGVRDGEDGVVFDTVIVDEAARTNPLDLFIPLAAARRQVVLIGDQNQLPQILEDDVEEEAARRRGDAEAARRDREGRAESLFGRLFEHFESRQRGAIRCVRLNEQYRMHSALGDLVSATYYRGELRSPRPAGEFAHALPGYASACAAWIDVPRSAGGEEEPRWRRQSEAARIAEELRNMLASPQGRDLSFGVISFYADQVREVDRALAERSVGVRGPGGQLELAVPGGKELRVGTVDAFQGREFDVVFLSTVRSNDRGAFGFLSLANRLCVALSRQKKLLVAVGDAAMFDGAAAAGLTPGLRALRDLTLHPTYGRRLE